MIGPHQRYVRANAAPGNGERLLGRSVTAAGVDTAQRVPVPYRAASARLARGHPRGPPGDAACHKSARRLLQAEPRAIDLFTGRRFECDRRSLLVPVARAVDASSASMVNLKAINA